MHQKSNTKHIQLALKKSSYSMIGCTRNESFDTRSRQGTISSMMGCDRINYSNHFKIGLTVYKAINLKQPPSFSKHLTLRTIPNNLRSTNTTILNYDRFAKSFGTRAFSTYAPRLWNSLPATVRQATSAFRKLLKVHYFCQKMSLY